MILRIENTITHTVIEYEVKDKNEGKSLYFLFNIDTKNLEDGEYKLTLLDGKEVIKEDILKIGDFNPKTLQYSKGDNTYISLNEPDLSAIGYNEKQSEEIVNKLLISPSVDVYRTWDENNTSSQMLFYGNTDLIVCPNIKTPNVTDMKGMFQSCSKLKTIPHLDTSSVINMYSLFYNCTSLETIPELDTSNVDNMDGMFYYCSSLETIPQIDTSNVTNMTDMFSDCSSLETIPQIDTSNVTNMNYMFYNCSSLKNVPELDTSKVTDMKGMFQSCSKLKRVGEFSAPKATTAEYLFNGCTSLESIGSYTHYLDLGECKYTSSIFGNCTSLKELPIINCPSISTESGFFGTSGGMLYDLVEVGGCISKHNQNGGRKWAICPNLSQASLQRIINCLYDYVGNGSSTRKGIAFHSNSKSLITDEMTAQAAAKGWSIVYK